MKLSASRTGKIKKKYLKHCKSSSLHVYVQTYIFDDVNLRSKVKKSRQENVEENKNDYLQMQIAHHMGATQSILTCRSCAHQLPEL